MEERVMIPEPSGLELAGVLHLPEVASDSCVVICHGMMSSKDSPKHAGIARTLEKLGYAAVRFDFSGRGESPGDLMGLSFSRQVEQCRAVLSLVRARGFARIALTGSSMGGAVAILTTAGEEIVALATMAAVGRADLLPERAVGQSGLAAWEREGRILVQGEPVGFALVEDSRRTDVPGAAARVACPWLILHGQEDEVIPVSDARLLGRASGDRALVEIVPGADHRFSEPAHREHLTSRITGFLHRVLSES